MLTVTITSFNRKEKISAINAIRNISGLGLKESKAIADTLLATGEPCIVEVLPEMSLTNVEGSLNDGEVIYTITESLSCRIKNVLIEALNLNRLDVADSLFLALKDNQSYR